MPGSIVDVGRPRVLLVEDEPAVGDALTDCLQQLGCTVVAAPKLRSATASARYDSEIFDAAILDLGLPDGNGLELVETLRSRPVPCVSLILTGQEEVEWARRAAAMGVTGFLRKPVSARLLSSEVAKAIARSREMRAWIRQDPGFDGEALGAVRAQAIVEDLDQPSSRPVRTPQEQVRLLSQEFGLTERQTEALERVSEGQRDRQIADAMGVSYSRVRQLLAASFGKLGVKSRNDFIRFLIERQKT
ncbi:MAG: response regulator transcription factor [Myxococcales bacterium]|nr:response regulator transcription factor [Myxococcales bacterium]